MKVAIVNGFDTFEHRAELLLSFFQTRNYDTVVLQSDFHHIKKEKRQERKENFYFFDTKQYKSNLSFQRLYSHWNLSKKIFHYIKQNPVDLLWVLVPPNSFVREAVALKKQFPHMTLIFDVIDMWPESIPLGRLNKFFPMTEWARLRDSYINMADHIVTECNLYQESLRSFVSTDKLSTIYLAREEKPMIQVENICSNGLSLCYLGSMNNIIDIPLIAKIVRNIAEESPVTLHLIGDGEKRNELIKETQLKNVDVIYHGKIYDEFQKQRIFSSCHFGLNIMKPSVFVGLTMKSIDYFEAGLPIINNIKGDTWDFVDQLGIGVNTEDGQISMESLKKCTNKKKVRTFYEEYFTKEIFNEQVSEILNKTGVN
ncbi:hypothetical protein D8798_05340 [Streptococcus cristatus]|uniref:Glycosyl transferase n=1 Tax=Streptococcus cristatus TaxID=45634 RepID=A0A428GHJ4_STRCR|nr:glycosyltransferase [Streptococcus cristatus]RSJ76404.1 hypothetical protein D8798_05340 [Streptococcus cristatus]